MNAKATDYTMILPTGKENAISTNELVIIMGFSDSRSLQADIAKSRNAGQIILSSTQCIDSMSSAYGHLSLSVRKCRSTFPLLCKDLHKSYTDFLVS